MSDRHPAEEIQELLPAFERAEGDTRRALAGLLREAADACESDDLGRLEAVLRSFHARDASWRRQRSMLENRRAALRTAMQAPPEVPRPQPARPPSRPTPAVSLSAFRVVGAV